MPTQISQTKFDSGQDVVPVYEGWIRNPDSSFDLVFGYFNRNFKEELAIPAGPNNTIEPGGPDRGQPTYFLPRRRARLFRVRVPPDWGQQVLTWTITANGRTEKAYGDLLPVQEINERIIMSGGNTVAFGDENPNKPPAIIVAPVSPASISNPVKLTATVTDDGLPKPRPPAVRPIAPSRNSATQGQINSTTGSPSAWLDGHLVPIPRSGQGDVRAGWVDSRDQRNGHDDGALRGAWNLHAGGDGQRRAVFAENGRDRYGRRGDTGQAKP